MTTIITIDGPAGSGKSTVAFLLAQNLQATYLDTGAMYRAITLACLRAEIDMDNAAAMLAIAENCQIDFEFHNDTNNVFLNGHDVTSEIRTAEVTAASAKVAGNDEIRRFLVGQQQLYAKDTAMLVTEGRDQGTLVFPDAQFKFYLDASAQCRAMRRYQQQKNKELSYEEILDAQLQRDNRDANRKLGALKPAEDSRVIDTTEMSIGQVVQKLISIIQNDR
ncbi:MAG: (d)CMP kinase [Phycisphaerae bacterium]|nr:(d)CMP kinase [Phycisphaerae bacterium]